jgi:hypothetical protein
MEPSMVESFEFFPQALGYDAMLKIFGTRGGSELYSPRNGLLISKRIITYFRNFSIVIVPNGDSNHGRWETLVLNEQLLNENQPEKGPNIFDVIHGKELTFKGRPRPAPRYAYFHYAVARMYAVVRKYAMAEKKIDYWVEPVQRGYLLERGLSALTKEITKSPLKRETLPELMEHIHGDGVIGIGGHDEVAKIVASNLKQRMKLES